MFSQSSRIAAGIYVRRAVRSEGFFFDEFAPDSAWIRERGTIKLPALPDLKQILIRGEARVHPDAVGIEAGIPSLDIFVGDRHISTIEVKTAQQWTVPIEVDPAWAADGAELSFRLRGVGRTNFLAWLARVAENHSFAERIQRFRRQNRNRQQCIQKVEADG